MAVLTLSRWAVFQCAHHLPKMPDGHKCRRVHGHTYKLTITCRGNLEPDGLIFDNALVDEVLQVVVAQLDHRNLNELDLPISDNPTAERMVCWIWVLASHVPVVGEHLWRIELEEGDRSVFALQREHVEPPKYVARDARLHLGMRDPMGEV